MYPVTVRVCSIPEFGVLSTLVENFTSKSFLLSFTLLHAHKRLKISILYYILSRKVIICYCSPCQDTPLVLSGRVGACAIHENHKHVHGWNPTTTTYFTWFFLVYLCYYYYSHVLLMFQTNLIVAQDQINCLLDT